ncbi:MAG TPA: alkyl sulfatase dimerization domain-containing protein [Arenicellales bacterium]|jgi:uncharacterized sulfatase|nr:alkyl sulfatase [Gammaproteobacteria bacterium]MDP6025632.1 alkyl sulfatase dimerization domain-containing protein [Pseudomonadales bacterium]MDP7314327.1 alkyl sulfatase dimerization domain-containing protein [Pseudomonadales bacterium]HJL53248.1 alkyl sulfatase dimerization domain-containing protein [Arenicellales bacterium]HJP50404.1 alkyl sulfatase dimerization domain-containing protein [Pseudomonadales bacterium]|tara:strand:+ start:276 stop:1535 length:1260 start_codon:yes stop_codon:yes gene_type:complete
MATEKKKHRGNPVTAPSNIGTVVPGVHVLGGMGNALSIETDDGIVQLDTGDNENKALEMIERLRAISDSPVYAIVYSHGHLGYNSAVNTWLAHVAERGDPVPRLIAHENLVKRYRRFANTAPLQQMFIEFQFKVPIGLIQGPLDLTMPTETFSDAMTLGTKGRRIQLLWAPSETDDTLVLWLPDEKVLYGSSAITPSIPNIGTPLRTLRDPIRWADTLDRLAALQPEIVIMEFGPHLTKPEKIQKILTATSAALRWVHQETIRFINLGYSIEEILHLIEYPDELFKQPWMAPTYGYADYIVRDIFRSETGWWDRNPTNLHPANPDDANAAVLAAISDRRAVIDSATNLVNEGKLQLALHVIDVLAKANSDDLDVLAAKTLKADICRKLAEQTESFVSQSLYVSSANIIEKGASKPTGVR